jgi:hypothetical protein
MPLLTSDIFQARSAFATLEFRAQRAELAVATLQSTVDTLSTAHQAIFDNSKIEHQFTLGQIAVNAQQNAQQASQVSPDLTLENFIAALGLSIALAEATMPDRTLGSVSASVQSFLTFNPGPDGVTKVPGLRLYQPELGAPTALATTSFDLTKTPGAPGTTPPKSLYSVLQEKQALYSADFWMGIKAGTPPTAQASQIVTVIATVFANIGGWSFPYLLQQAGTVALSETALAAALTGASTPPPSAVAAYTAAVAGLTNLLTALSARTIFVAGDLYALAAALDNSTSRALAVHA